MNDKKVPWDSRDLSFVKLLVENTLLPVKMIIFDQAYL